MQLEILAMLQKSFDNGASSCALVFPRRVGITTTVRAFGAGHSGFSFEEDHFVDGVVVSWTCKSRL